jgi:predicted transcriptional regulator
MDKFELFFELSSRERVDIMLLVQGGGLKLSHVSKKLNVTVTETSRHLQRLCEARLLEKDVEGAYGLTPFGHLVLSLIPSFGFLSAYGDYLATHSLSFLPQEFIERIGELEACGFTNDVMVTFRSVEILIDDAMEYVCILSNQILASTLPLLETAIKRGVKVKIIVPEDLVPPPRSKPFSSIPGAVERRILKSVGAIVILSEKQARLAFPHSNGTMDYVGFDADEKAAHGWCEDLFMYYWAMAHP